LWGVGPKGAARLAALGIKTVGELAEADPEVVEKAFGSWALGLQAMARGFDDRGIETEHERKSVGAERTFPKDLADGPELREQIGRIAEEVARRMEHHGSEGRVVHLKLRYHYFRTLSRQKKLAEPTADAARIRETAEMLLERVATPTDRFRLIGIQVSELTAPAGDEPSTGNE
jgi:DNA polymerase-4